MSLNEIYIFGQQSLDAGVAIMQSHRLPFLHNISISSAVLRYLEQSELSDESGCWTDLVDGTCFIARDLAALG